MNCMITAAGPIGTRFRRSGVPENRETFRESAESAILTKQTICSTHTVYAPYTCTATFREDYPIATPRFDAYLAGESQTRRRR